MDIGQILAQQTELKMMSQQLVNLWYQSYQQSEEAPSCDIIVAKYELDTTPYLAFLKLNYSQGYTHFLDQTEKVYTINLFCTKRFCQIKRKKSMKASL